MARGRQFTFDREAARYYRYIESGPYPRLMAWEFLWDWVKGQPTWTGLASPRRIQRTALHLGLYLANWGMFRGSSGLLRINLDFFEAFVAHLFEGQGVPRSFWRTSFEEFAPGNKRRERAGAELNEAVARIKEFGDGTVTWTPTLVSKILMGVWGQIPAFDIYFLAGWRSFVVARPRLDLQKRLRVDAGSAEDLARAQAFCGWKLGGYRTRHGRNSYPAGKVIDMAFFRYGGCILRGW